MSRLYIVNLDSILKSRDITLPTKVCLVKAIYCQGVRQGCNIPCLFKLYAEYIMRNAGLEEAQARIKIASEISITSDNNCL